MMSFFYPILAAVSGVCQIDPDHPNNLCNPTHAADIPTFLTNLLVAFGVLIGIFTIGMVAYSGLRMIISQGNEESVTAAKSSLRWSISGLVIILLAFAIVSAVGQFFQYNKDVDPPTGGQIISPILNDDIISLSQTVFNGFLSVVGIVAIFFIVISGFRYITARGDDEQVTQAKQGLKWAILGLIVATLAFVIVTAFSKFIQQN